MLIEEKSQINPCPILDHTESWSRTVGPTEKMNFGQNQQILKWKRFSFTDDFSHFGVF